MISDLHTHPYTPPPSLFHVKLLLDKTDNDLVGAPAFMRDQQEMIIARGNCFNWGNGACHANNLRLQPLHTTPKRPLHIVLTVPSLKQYKKCQGREGRAGTFTTFTFGYALAAQNLPGLKEHISNYYSD